MSLFLCWTPRISITSRIMTSQALYLSYFGNRRRVLRSFEGGEHWKDLSFPDSIGFYVTFHTVRDSDDIPRSSGDSSFSSHGVFLSKKYKQLLQLWFIIRIRGMKLLRAISGYVHCCTHDHGGWKPRVTETVRGVRTPAIGGNQKMGLLLIECDNR